MQITFMVNEYYNDESIAELDLSETIENCLRRNGVYFVGDVVKHIENDTLGKLKGLGVTKERAIKNALFNFELCVSGDPIEFIMNCERVA